MNYGDIDFTSGKTDSLTCPTCHRYVRFNPARITVGCAVQFAATKLSKGEPAARLYDGKVIGDLGDGLVKIRFRVNKVVTAHKESLTLLTEPDPFMVAKRGFCNCAKTTSPVLRGRLTCDTCGEPMVGDGYSSPAHCPNADTDGFEPDCNPIHCTGEDPE